MTNEEINRAIAEHLGWQWKDTAIEKPSLVLSTKIVWEKRWHSPSGDVFKVPRDYVNDLNAMHEAEMEIWLLQNTWDTYKTILQSICGHDGIAAKASQRAEAFLRTYNKWKE